jgi:Caspase domain/Curli production assembly/transport component CsgG/Sel1 repeat
MNATTTKTTLFFHLKHLIVVAFVACSIGLSACQKSPAPPESSDKPSASASETPTITPSTTSKTSSPTVAPESTLSSAVATANTPMSLPGVGKLESEAVSVQGFGISPGAAVADAMKLAILQVNGAAIENDNVNSRFGLDLALNDTPATIRGQTFADTMSQRSGGVIQSLVVTELLEPTKPGGFFRASVNAKVAKFAPSADLKKIRIVVSAPKFPRDRVVIGEQSFTSSEIGNSIRRRVADALTNTGRVAVLDRDMNDEIDRELDLIASGNTPATERAKLSQVASADLVWTARVESMQYVKSSRQLRMSSRELVSFNGSWALSHKLVNVATRQVTLADQISRTLPGTSPTTLGASVNSTKILGDITDEIVSKSVAAILRTVEGYEIVDCELPNPATGSGQPGQPIRASASECTLRGGVYTLAGQASGETALKMWLPLASQGDKKAQMYVGQIYEKGMGRTADYASAAEWYRKAADQNYPAAQTALAVLHERGVIGGKSDPVAALALYRKAAQVKEGLVPVRDVTGRDKDNRDSNNRDKEIADLKAQLEIARNEAKQQGETLKQKEDQIRTAISQLKRDLLQARAAKDNERISRVERELREREEEEAQSSRKRMTAEADATRSANALTGINADPPPVDSNLPQIQLIEPVSVAMRGIITVRIRPDLKEIPVIAKIAAKQPLSKITINDATLTPDAQGIVSTAVTVTGKTTAVQIAAVDKNGKRATLSFVMASSDLVQEPLRTSTTPPVRGVGNYYALVIGNANYKSWETLKTPITDAQAVSAVLEKKYGFKVTTLVDATRSRIFKEIARLRSTLNENDNLLIYYSGHGHWDTANLNGYWVPVDAEKENFANYISSSDITEQLSALRARQVLVVADACYAGVLVRSVADQLDKNVPANKAEWLQNRALLQSRKVMSSGGVRQVMDGGAGKHSIFARQFLDGISRRTDMFEAHELYSEIAPRVEKTALGFGEQQQPQYGQLRFAGHVGGDFLFVPKS